LVWETEYYLTVKILGWITVLIAMKMDGGGCLCSNYNVAIYDSNLDGIYDHETEYCLSGTTYSESLGLLEEYPDTIRFPLFDIDGNEDSLYSDPNRDDWCYNTTGCNSTSVYSRMNGTEGNGQAMGYRYPDTEDLDRDNTLDIQNDYFTFSFAPKDTIMMELETENSDGSKTGWKLFRIPLTGFDTTGTPQWNDVPTFHIRSFHLY